MCEMTQNENCCVSLILGQSFEHKYCTIGKLLMYFIFKEMIGHTIYKYCAFFVKLIIIIIKGHMCTFFYS